MKIFSARARSRSRTACRLSSLVAASLFVATAEGATAPAAVYSVTTLGILNYPGSSGVVRRVNSLGEAVGSYRNKGNSQSSTAFLVTTSGFEAIPTQQHTDFSTSYGINDLGEIAGTVNGPTSMLPFRSVRMTGFQLLPLLDKDTGGGAYGINDQGESVGFSSGPFGVRPIWWTRAGQPTSLPILPGVESTKAIDINSRGDIVGNAGESKITAVLWAHKGSIVPLDTLATYTNSQAESINNKGDIAGFCTAYDGTPIRVRAVLWAAGTLNPQDLGTLSGGQTSRARDVDMNDLVVGTSDSSQGNRAFIWSSTTGMQDLNALSADKTIVLVDALSINKSGTILALGINKSDYPPGDSTEVEEHELPRHIVLLTPIK